MNASDVPNDIYALAFVVTMLGARHGFDADHLAAIDAMTRFNAADRPRLARRVGVLFSLGHGLVVVSAALAVAALAGAWQVPAWLEAFGACLSIGVLCLLGLINLVAVVRTPAGRVVRLAGWRSSGFSRWLAAGSAWWVAGVGALFALSFDTVSLAALIAVAAARFGGTASLLALAGLFVLGMLVTDGVNSLWIAGLVRKSDATAAIASRVMACAVAGLSLATAGLGVASLALPAVHQWSSRWGLWMGVGIVAIVLSSFGLGLYLSARGRRRAGGSTDTSATPVTPDAARSFGSPA